MWVEPPESSSSKESSAGSRPASDNSGWTTVHGQGDQDDEEPAMPAKTETITQANKSLVWPDRDLDANLTADIPGYSKHDRFQVRMSLVNRETQLFTYPALMYFAEMEFARAARYQRPFTMITMQLGTHSAQDPLRPNLLRTDGLALVGTRIMDIKRSTDLLGHFAPSGLAILLPETEKTPAFELAKRLAKMFADIEPTEWTNWHPLRYLIGIAGVPDDGATLRQLLAEAVNYRFRNENV
jgi:hypothetical protein